MRGFSCSPNGETLSVRISSGLVRTSIRFIFDSLVEEVHPRGLHEAFIDHTGTLSHFQKCLLRNHAVSVDVLSREVVCASVRQTPDARPLNTSWIFEFDARRTTCVGLGWLWVSPEVAPCDLRHVIALDSVTHSLPT